MQRVRQILLFLKRGYSEREIAKQTKVSRPTVHLYFTLFRATGRSYDELLSLKDPDLDAVFSKTQPVKAEPENPRKAHFLDQLSYFILELKRVGVTRYLLWQEYLQLYPAGFQYSRFCGLLDIEMAVRKPAMHLEHNPGELLEIDFAGSKLHYVNEDGEIIECPVLVAVLPFSGYSFVQALPNATLPYLIGALNAILEYFQGVPMNAISDNMKQWVTRTCKYEPTFPEMLREWALHNQIGLLATRPGSPKDKPSAENNVLITYRRVFALLRNDTSKAWINLIRLFSASWIFIMGRTFKRKAIVVRSCLMLKKNPFYRLYLQQAIKSVITQGPRSRRTTMWYWVKTGISTAFLSAIWAKKLTWFIAVTMWKSIMSYSVLLFIPEALKSMVNSTLLDHMPENHRKIAERRSWNPKLALLDILEDLYGNGATIITSQLPLDKWYEFINEPTIADAALDRLTASAHKVDLLGGSMRKENKSYY